MADTITAIIPTVGRASLLAAVDSAKNQLGVDVKIVIVDDSEKQNINVSTPGVTVLRSGGKRGVSASRNIGLDFAVTDFVGFLDDDDLWNVEKSRRQIEWMKEKEIEISITSAFVRGKKSRNRPSKLIKPELSPIQNLYRKHQPLGNSYYLPMAGVLISKKVAQEFRFKNNLQERENIEYLDQIFWKGYKIHQMNFVGVEISYSSQDSLKRINLATELSWAKKMMKFGQNELNNFYLESERNFIRVNKRAEALIMLQNLENGNNRHKLLKILYNVFARLS